MRRTVPTLAAVALTLCLAATPAGGQPAPAPSTPAEPAKPAKPEADVHDVTVNESWVADPYATFTVRLARKPTRRTTVTWRTVDGTARAGRDYAAASGKVVLRPGQRTRTFAVEVLLDEETEATEYFSVALSSQQARLTRKRATASIIDDDLAPFLGEVQVQQRWEQDANGFHTLETWTLTLTPRLVAAGQGTAWYDNGFGEWQLTGSRILEDHRPGAECRTVEEETWSGEGVFFTEPHPDTDVAGITGNLVVEAFFPQHAGNLGQDPRLHVVVSGRTDGTSYSFDGESCVGTPYANEERFALDEAPAEVVRTRNGPVLVFDHYAADDRSTETELDLFEVAVVGELRAEAQTPAAAFSASARSVRSQVNSGSSRPK